MAHIHIPPDISREILLLLPPKSLIRFRSVCKAWQAIIDDPCFVKAHTDTQQPSILLRNSSGPPFHPLYTFDLETLNPTNGFQTIPASALNLTPSGLSRLSHLPVATCNGLMLIPPEKPGQTWEMWNTLTQERLELPQKSSNWLTVGLGYDCSSDDYKAVAIAVQRRGRRRQKFVYQTHVYSLKSDTWRRIDDFPCAPYCFLDRLGPGAFLGGALHWISERGHRMFALDVGTENFNELKPPPGLRDRDRQYFIDRQFHVDVLDGCLAVTDFGQDDDDLLQHFDIWVMKDYGVEDSWTKLYKLPAVKCGYPPRPSVRWLRPIAYMKDNMKLLMQDRWRFYLFDVENFSSKKVDIQGLSGLLTAQVFHGSIFRLHDNCGVGGNLTAERRRRRIWEKESMNIIDTQLLFCVRDFRFGPADDDEISFGLDDGFGPDDDEISFGPVVIG